RLLRLPVHATFVFDGPQRPTKKHGTRVITTEHWMLGAMKSFIEAFGFDYRTAPGEAEAELTLLNQLGFIHGIMTDNSDALVFGAQTMICK
ncbi:PIN domain-like protein, partial [Fomitopsis serialis]|uniref:PIN domain-like protein n=1 Tax=Fomitopsis serialis TaxID=139415 RepID=UPI002007532A